MEHRYAGPRAITILGLNTGTIDLTQNGWGHQVKQKNNINVSNNMVIYSENSELRAVKSFLFFLVVDWPNWREESCVHRGRSKACAMGQSQGRRTSSHMVQGNMFLNFGQILVTFSKFLLTKKKED